MLGCVTDDQSSGTTAIVQWHELDRAVRDGAVRVDVRTCTEHEAGGIPGSLHVPVDELRARLDEIPIGRPAVVYCHAGLRSDGRPHPDPTRTQRAQPRRRLAHLAGGTDTSLTACGGGRAGARPPVVRGHSAAARLLPPVVTVVSAPTPEP
ncbi:rhodanese-like domain-containing protein [Streptomyces shenzhenensis]|uniref:rhodanese-like domain-containing protein n=1 Tax=Streptomyces shenzhenensis TaxID=943815 RepID=UPI00355929FC